MPSSLIMALSLTMLYLLLTLNKEIYDNVYRRYFHTDFVFTLTVSMWVYYCFGEINKTLGMAMAVVTYLAVFTGQFSIYYTNKQKAEEESKEVIDLNPATGMEQKEDPMTMFNGKRGIIKEKINGNYYLGDINMGSDEVPSVQDILLYNEDGFEVGDTYEITHVEGYIIMAKKV